MQCGRGAGAVRRAQTPLPLLPMRRVRGARRRAAPTVTRGRASGWRRSRARSGRGATTPAPLLASPAAPLASLPIAPPETDGMEGSGGNADLSEVLARCAMPGLAGPALTGAAAGAGATGAAGAEVTVGLATTQAAAASPITGARRERRGIEGRREGRETATTADQGTPRRVWPVYGHGGRNVAVRMGARRSWRAPYDPVVPSRSVFTVHSTSAPRTSRRTCVSAS